MNKKSEVEETITIKASELQQMIREVIREELEALAVQPEMDIEPIEAEEMDEVYSEPEEMTVQPAGFWGSTWKATKRVGRTVGGLATAPVTAVYSGVTRDPSAFKWSARQTVDGVGGGGTWNRMTGYVNSTYYFRVLPVYQYGLIHHFNVFCGRCNSMLGASQSPVIRPMNCGACGAHLVPGG